MKRPTAMALCTAALAACLGATQPTSDAGAQDAGPAAEHRAARGDVGEDAECLIYWGAEHPVFLGVAISIDGRPHREAWAAAVGDLFDAYDRDADGTVTAGEGLPQLQALIAAELAAGAPAGAAVGAPVSLDRGGLLRHLAGRGVRPLVVQGGGSVPAPTGAAPRADGTGAGGAAAVDNRVLFRVLDADGSGGLSRGELTTLLAPHGRLNRLDLDEDERISARELLLAESFASRPTAASPGVTPLADRPAPGGGGPAAGAGGFTPIDSPRPLARALLDRYDDDRDGFLTAVELGLAPMDLAPFDQDEDGQLDQAETARFLRRPTPGAVLACTWRGEETDFVVVGQRSGETPDAPADEASSEGPGGAEAHTTSIGLAGQSVLVSLSPRAALPVADAAARLLARLDGDGNGYLDRAEAELSPPARRAFAAMDADADGQVTGGEFVEYARRAALVTPRQFVLTFQTQPRNVFEAIDADRDALLSRAELNSLAAGLPQWDADRDGALTPDELSAPARLSIGPRGTWLQPATSTTPAASAGGRRPTGLPAWFTAMDRNRDAAVSRREFLGSLKHFAALDADHDGLVSIVEADRAATDVPPPRHPRP